MGGLYRPKVTVHYQQIIEQAVEMNNFKVEPNSTHMAHALLTEACLLQDNPFALKKYEKSFHYFRAPIASWLFGTANTKLKRTG